ncbi:hydrogenase maturation nickel metallochaperone HypA [Sorangium sp. So ce513]|uniref:hydrogenase maturation nickel metallochaperone HypA/HybF n=1 Tax=Sorangium sp. So ce513 TaxID=3133315 RepID=UPI003F5D8A58
MHELSLTRNVVGLAAERARGRRVTQVRLRIGRLAGVEVEAVRFCFDVCARGTEVAGARLVVDEVPGRGECASCGEGVALEHLVAVCPCERRAPLRIVAGEELLLVDIELEDG